MDHTSKSWPGSLSPCNYPALVSDNCSLVRSVAGWQMLRDTQHNTPAEILISQNIPGIYIIHSMKFMFKSFKVVKEKNNWILKPTQLFNICKHLNSLLVSLKNNIWSNKSGSVTLCEQCNATLQQWSYSNISLTIQKMGNRGSREYIQQRNTWTQNHFITNDTKRWIFSHFVYGRYDSLCVPTRHATEAGLHPLSRPCNAGQPPVIIFVT